MNYTYCITLNHHFKNAWGIIIFIAFALFFPVFMKYKFGADDLSVFKQYACIGFLLLFIPQLCMHLGFYFLNKGRVLHYYPSSLKMAIEIHNIRYDFTFDEIESIERNKSFPLAENRMLCFPWDSYNYSVIQLKNGQRFLVTSLLVPNLDLPLPPEKIKLRKRFYSYPFGVNEVLDEA